MKINKMSHLKREIDRTIKKMTEDDGYGNISMLIYNENVESPNFLITIEKQDLEYFIDAKGRKWVLSSDHNGVNFEEKDEN